MGFFRKLFGNNENKKNENNNENKNENLTQSHSNNGSDNDNMSEDEVIEVIVNDTNEYESVELLDDEEEVEIPDVKSIEQIIDDVTGLIEQKELVAIEDLLGAQEFFREKNAVNNETDINVSVKFEEPLILDDDTKKTVDKVVEEAIDKAVEEAIEEAIEESVEEAVEEMLQHSIEEAIEDEILHEAIKETIEEIVEESTKETQESEEIQESTEEIQEPEEIQETTEEIQEEKQEKKSFFAKLKEGVKKTRDSIFGNLNSVFNMFTTVDEELFEELEEALILADMGVDTSLYIINELRKRVKKNGIKEVHEVRETLIDIISEILNKDETEFEIIPPTVLLVIGVNGAGKTTTIGKLSNNYIKSGHTVTVAAADTFRAAAIEQLQVWADRTGANFIRKEEGSDPASVVFDACKSAKAKNTDVLIIDTAGRLQNKKNLMEELKKINRIIDREFPEAHKEVFLVLDSTTGQNAMQQAKLFNESADITGLVLTKLDGTAKGGVIVSIKNELSVPVRYVGLGEKVDDLEPFDSKQFAKALFE